jgi:hypothetical protein
MRVFLVHQSVGIRLVEHNSTLVVAHIAKVELHRGSEVSVGSKLSAKKEAQGPCHTARHVFADCMMAMKVAGKHTLHVTEN